MGKASNSTMNSESQNTEKMGSNGSGTRKN
jgi:hypothetical protein